MTDRVSQITREIENHRRAIAKLEAEKRLLALGLWHRVQDRAEGGVPGIGISGDSAWIPLGIGGREYALSRLAEMLETEEEKRRGVERNRPWTS